jgi:hypothetical protein
VTVNVPSSHDDAAAAATSAGGAAAALDSPRAIDKASQS